MRAIVFLAVMLALILATAFGVGTWHRGHPAAAASAARGWWARRGWAWSRPGYLTAHLALGLCTTAATLLVFAQICDWVTDNGAITQFDQQFDQALHATATAQGLRIATVLSLIGGPSAMAALAVVGAAYLYVVHRDRELLLGWVFAFAGGGVLDWVLKTAFRRPRPLFVDPFAHGYGFSFPSGHSMGSVIGFGILAYVLVQSMHREVAKVVTVALTAALCVAVGASRLYLGVHFPSDVLGGFAAGSMWLAACLSGLEIARARHDDSTPVSGERSPDPAAARFRVLDDRPAAGVPTEPGTSSHGETDS